MTAKAIMLQGTGSDVGKSLLAAGLCRLLANRGHAVRPFKPQNMSNNAAVTAGGGEIGRAQALQARACRTASHVDMNPVLLKPQSEVGAQLVVRGEMRGSYKARDFQGVKAGLMPEILESFARLKDAAEFVIVEGAGSAAEVNLRTNDIANMGFALAAHVPVALIADIDRGGVIASLVGTHALLTDAERDLVQGYVINRFRGDVSLFAEGLTAIGGRTGMRSFGILPYLEAARRLPEEDAMTLENRPGDEKDGGGGLVIAVPRLAHIANFDDFDPLRAEPDVRLVMVRRGQPLPGDADLIILPGSKNTLADMADFRDQGWHIDLLAHVRRGGTVLGLCAGFQMLGRVIRDPLGVEGNQVAIEGLALLDLETELGPEKALREVDGRAFDDLGPVRGYEMHVGRSEPGPGLRPFAELAGRSDGAVSADGRIMGCYLHGLFAEDGFRHRFLTRLRDRAVSGISYESQVEAALDDIAAALESHLEIEALLSACR